MSYTRKISIDGVVYDSIMDAVRILNIPHPTIQKRLINELPKWDNYQYIDGKPIKRRPYKKVKVIPFIGAYEFKNGVTGHLYVGSARHLQMRKNAHLHLLRKNKHNNYKVQQAWNETNADDWKFKFYLTWTIEEARNLEQSWIDANWNNPLFLNLATDAKSSVTGMHALNGTLLTPEERLKRITENQNRRQNYLDTEDQRRSIGERAPHSKPVIIDGIRYPTIAVAAYETGMPTDRIRNRTHSKLERYSEYNWAKPEPNGIGVVRLAKPEDILEESVPHKPPKRPKRKGVYTTKHIASGKIWVGFSLTDVDRKSIEEYGLLRRNNHTAMELQTLYNQNPNIETGVEYAPEETTFEELMELMFAKIKTIPPEFRILPQFRLHLLNKYI
jgi:hypothetical protein